MRRETDDHADESPRDPRSADAPEPPLEAPPIDGPAVHVSGRRAESPSELTGYQKLLRYGTVAAAVVLTALGFFYAGVWMLAVATWLLAALVVFSQSAGDEEPQASAPSPATPPPDAGDREVETEGEKQKPGGSPREAA